MTQSERRKNIFFIIFQSEFHGEDELEREAELFLELSDDISEKDREYILGRSLAVHEKIAEIDKTINGAAQRWKTSRMGKAELAIIRLAVYEMLYDDDVPQAVAINEAVELAKEFGDARGASFVNGILARIIKNE